MTNLGIKTAQKWLKDADAILVTASNGFSISEGLNLFANDEKLRTVLGDLVDKYHFQNLLNALSYHYTNKLDQWRAYARVSEYYVYNYHPGELMADLKKILGNKPSFIWTSNVDHHFKIGGFDNLLEIEGSWTSGVCSAHPQEHPVVSLNETLHQIYEKDQAGTLTEDDLPTCEECGAPIAMNVPGPTFRMNQEQVQGFKQFIEQYQDKNILVLELGIGPHNQLIKAPSMQLVASNSHAHYITINKGQLLIPDVIGERSIGFSSSIQEAFDALLTGKGELEIQGPAKPAPKLTPEQQAEQEKMLKQFYPSYMVDRGIRPGELTMYMTVDKDHPSYLHMIQDGQSLMYSLGDAAIVHCFTQDGQYYSVRLGLDKTKKEVHGFYVNAGTFIAIEDANDSGAGFSQVSAGISANASSELLVPRVDQLTKLFPNQKELIERLSVKQ
ncbi:Sir2 silent information regulator family NAD-dependent deacetylase [Limosilactobacillus fastidiosus]|nr:Sir2 silent information regulator family NAD-dependent deacetylase [Limosilactobacillus fastidiosus]MCD7084687.1 Sir2 silent information regulator family NAD-dependent deacetylase [Limosilactobacillus fastidiosus]MCD7085763.1 Sir2 silent information regulator family NAD-dependent deacetylase [Limosilactobacillus fastidiosus]MCD7113840.1 Sir2 silent information regulator family NAD-dependent deacetylase [Limosilactobacillus fastidiosus]MCD7115672.1 Sir2 silent information regulator family NAD